MSFLPLGGIVGGSECVEAEELKALARGLPRCNVLRGGLQGCWVVVEN